MSATKMTPEELSAYDAETVRMVVEFEKRVAAASADYELLKADASAAKKSAEAKADELRGLIRDREEARGKRPAPTLLDVIPATVTKWRAAPLDALALPDDLTTRLKSYMVDTVGELHAAITSYPAEDGAPYKLTLAELSDVRAAVQRLIDAEADATPDPTAAAADTSELWREYPIDRWVTHGLTLKDVDKLAAGEMKGGAGGFPIVTVGDLQRFSEPGPGGYQRRLADVKGIGPAGVDRISEAETAFWGWWRAGGEAEFAAERGLTNGAPTHAGTDGGATPAADSGGEPDNDATDPDGTDLYAAEAAAEFE